MIPRNPWLEVDTILVPKEELLFVKVVGRVTQYRVVGYALNKEGKKVAVEAKFIFTMLDRKLNKKNQTKIYRRVDDIRSAWGRLFVVADCKVSRWQKDAS